MRIEWSGQESTFGVEGALTPVLKRRFDEWEFSLEGEFYLNQPFDRNMLVDTPERRSYLANFQPQTLEISQLSVSCRRGDLLLKFGKMDTPFGRYYFPTFTNAHWDAPFIRSECILWRETGLLARYSPGMLVVDAAITNGGEDRDANSSKALLSRVGLQGERWAVGASLKLQDGIGSESQKEFKNHVGMDAMVRLGPFTLSGEVLYDEYGFRQSVFNPDEIYWGRSIYYRDLNYLPGVPFSGVGYYVDLGYCRDRWIASLNYGEYYPQQEIGIPGHDETVRRGLARVAYDFGDGIQTYSALILENDGYIAQDNRKRIGRSMLAGVQVVF